MDLHAEIRGLREAVVTAADLIEARAKDGSFLERTLRDALVDGLEEARPEVRLTIDSWLGRLGGVDVVYKPSSTGGPLGVETKVWDVSDSLFDVLKLAAATQQHLLAAGFVVAAGRRNDWRAPSVVRVMSLGGHDAPQSWSTVDLLRREDSHWPRIWSRSSARPQAVPATFQTLTIEPVAMSRVPDHEIRIIGIQAVGTKRVALDADGRATR